MKPVRVIGLGSPFGDDRVGWLAIARLRRSRWPRRFAGGLTLLDLDRPGIGLTQAMAGARAIVLVDAIHSGAAPGTLHRLIGRDLARPGAPVSSHDLGVAAAVGLAAALGELPESLVLLGIEIAPPNESAALSPAVAQRLPALVDAVAAELGRLSSIKTAPGPGC